jgi:predicted metal-dependent peptidase
MEAYVDRQSKELYEKAKRLMKVYFAENQREIKADLVIPEEFRREFNLCLDKVNLCLLEDKDNFYGYFMFQMSREIRFDISSPTAVNFHGAKYVIYFNPMLFLKLSLQQMESTIKHEILHILSMHILRAKELKGSYCNLAINMAMDIVVNKYLSHLPPYATTLEWVNLHYNLHLKPYQSFEYYVEKLQPVLDLQESEKKELEVDSEDNEFIEAEYDAERTHDLWEETDEVEAKTLSEFTEKVMGASKKGEIEAYIESMIEALRGDKGELPWNWYLSRLMGTVESNRKKTITRRSRRQPERVDLRGQLRSHKSKIAVALDISASMSEEEFHQAIAEVLNIVKNYNHEITIIECDDEIRRTYQVKSAKDIKGRTHKKGGTKFSPVFEHVNQKKFNLLIYFTDGKGEEKLRVIPRGYKTLWILSGRGDQLSLKEPFGVVKKLSNIEVKDNILDATEVSKGGFSMNNQEKL